MFDSQACNMLRAATVTAAMLPRAFSTTHVMTDTSLNHPTPATIKFMSYQLAVMAGTLQQPPEMTLMAEEAVINFYERFARIRRRRFGGSTRRYLEFNDHPDKPAILLLSIPPKRSSEWAEWASHQATFGDDINGIYTAGLRLCLDNLLALPNSILPDHLRGGLLNRFCFPWITHPNRCCKKNYQSCIENIEAVGTEIDRLANMNVLEGPLHYVPHICNPMACIVKHEPYKVRMVLDSLRTGVNECMSKPDCVLDMLCDVASRIRKGSRISKFDQSDAFLTWPISGLTRDRDMLGICDPRPDPATGQPRFWRYTYCPFGLKAAPALQQEMAQVIAAILKSEGLQFCMAGSPEGDYENYAVIGKYLDDFMQEHAPCLDDWQATLQFYSAVATLHKYGIPLKPSKLEPPLTCRSWMGCIIDTITGMISIDPKKGTKVLLEIRQMLKAFADHHSVPRVQLASVVGKLQHLSQCVLQGQSQLSASYKSRDSITLPPSAEPVSAWSSRAWTPDILCQLSAASLVELSWWSALLQSDHPPRRRFLWPHGGPWGSFLTPRLARTLSPSSAQELLSKGWVIITTDASGFAGGAWYESPSGSKSFVHYPFSPEQLQAHFGSSSNMRELFMAPYSLDHWSAESAARDDLAARCILFLMDNQASIGAINRRGSMNPHFNDLILWMLRTLNDLGSEALAVYLPGALNVLSDGISRLTGSRDPGDLLFSPYWFGRISTSFGPFSVDAFSDALGHNAVCREFWSPLNSALTQDWAGHSVWAHPPIELLTEALRHFWHEYTKQPTQSSALFVLPCWPTAAWWRMLGGSRLVAYFPASSALFTAPDWRTASKRNPLPITRIPARLTQWPTVCVYFPRSSDASGDPDMRAHGLPRLRGSQAHDTALVRRMPHSTVR